MQRPLRQCLAGLLTLVVVLGACEQASDEPAEPVDSVDVGKKLYRDHGCALCHGEGGLGDGRMARSLDPPPRDFSKSDQFALGHTVDAVAEAIRTGAVGRGAMPGYGHLSETDRRALAVFIVSLAEAPHE